MAKGFKRHGVARMAIFGNFFGTFRVLSQYHYAALRSGLSAFQQP